QAVQAVAGRSVAGIAASGRRAECFNVNAADDTKRSEVVAAITSTCGGDPPESRVSVFLHSLAFGTLKPFFGASREASIAKAQLEMTVDVMANSLVYWVQDLHFGGLLAPVARVFAMASGRDH